MATLKLSAPTPTLTPMTLAHHDRAILELAGARYRYMAVREQHMREQLGMTPVQFWAKIDRLLDDPAAEAAMPMIVRRLRRQRQARRDVRSSRRLLQG